MSDDLTHLLADPEQATVVFLPADALPAVRQAADDLRLVLCEADLHGCDDAGAVLQRLSRALQLPEWFGGNWDALEDCINDLSWLPGEGCLLLLRGIREWMQRDADGVQTLLDIGREAAVRWSESGVPFWMIVEQPAGIHAPE